MTNLSLGSRIKYLLGLSLALFVVFAGMQVRAGMSGAGWAVLAALTLLLVVTFYTVHRILKAIAKLTEQLEAAARGELDQRMTGIRKGGATEKLSWALNDLLDQQEAYFREVFSAFEHASRGQTFRRAMDQGLHGAFQEAMHRINISVEALGKVQEMANKERLISRVTNLNSGHLIENLKSIQAYLLDMTEELGVVGRLSSQTAQDADASRATIESLVGNLNRMTEMVAETHAHITLIHDKSEEITQIVQVISEVADRTNLLALNAAIEAAHAGEVGKGFAVVAEEVRTLSENTKDAATSIASTIEAFGQATTRMITDSEQVREIAESSRASVAEFSTKVLQFADSAKTSFTQVNKTQDYSFACLVKVDHFLYKQNGYRVIHQGPGSPEAQAVRTDHRGCRLGKWYHEGEGAAHFSHVPSYGRLETPHAGVHGHVHAAIGLLDERWEKDPEIQNRIFDHFDSAERASVEVVQVIDRMVEERHR